MNAQAEVPEPRTDLNAGELDCLSVLWTSQRAMRVSEIHETVEERRRQAGEAPPALTTVSTWLRSLYGKRLVKEVTIGAAGESQSFARGTRGLIPTSRSPYTGYEAVYEPGAVLEKTFKALADAYPPTNRKQAVIDFARAALGLPEKTLKKLERLLDET